MLELLPASAAMVFSLQSIVFMCIGLAVGLALGAIPGLGPSIGIGVLLPITFGLEPVAAMILLIGLYKGSLLGGTISAILLNTPGTSGAVATVIDGYPMSQKGFGKKALQGAILSSGFADICSDVFLIIGSVSLAGVALLFGPPEMFWVIIFALILTSTLSGQSMWKGFLSMGLGMLVGSVGRDPLVGTPRLGIGPDLGRINSLELVAVLIGLFAISEIFINLSTYKKSVSSKKSNNTTIYGPSINLSDIKESLKSFFIGTSTGTITGIIPGLGASAAAFLSYTITKSAYGGETKEGNFGEGVLPGVVSAESGNSAVSGSNMLPMFVLGIPGSSVAALLLAALGLQGITPGPGIFDDHGEVIYAIFLALIIANFINMIFANVMIKPLIWILKRDPKIVYPIVLFICMIGVYAVNNRMLDVGVTIGIGFLAYLMKKGSIPVAPMALAFILSGQLERGLRRSLQTSQGEWDIFISSSISQIGLVLCVLAVSLVVWQNLNNRRMKVEGDRIDEQDK
ncbi:tripartite tricarboxylate transporter permease [Natranaerobius trueperi]|uniref:C4-dicarboxylate ABC transporter permease n=1 Tax=Natranaerobius trueperi TaxID=759412 RepID=A0A226BW35_9FIRM|nr:tripartite tricarboxylate transporter permease [Natranaerobius trueperi]OWZ83216.1 C4-dicarboxylate ABC transporter permease [Natranaerobius trueperi]